VRDKYGRHIGEKVGQRTLVMYAELPLVIVPRSPRNTPSFVAHFKHNRANYPVENLTVESHASS
jgi:hypothetical protein